MMAPGEADSHAAMTAAYVHVPFCAKVCPYCDFAVVAGRDDLISRYIDALCLEIERAEPWRPLTAVYFGGGTPSHVDPSLLSRVLSAIGEKHTIAPGAEMSIEVNPEDLTLDLARSLVRVGFNRLSLGAQSFDGAVLTSLGRRHDAGQIASAVRSGRAVGFTNISLDLIYGTPGESDGSWESSLAAALATGPDHVSCYALTVEPGTELGRAVRDGAPAPDPDVQAARHRTADDLLSGAGYERYEVSNWSKPGRECRYNLIVWAQGEYEAYGNGAHGHRNGHRSRNMRRLDSYLEAVEAGHSPRAGGEAVIGWGGELDRVFVGLRRTVGVRSGPATDALVASDEGRRLLEAGVIAMEGTRLVVKRPLLTDEVHRAVLGLAPPEGYAEAGTRDNVSVKAHA